MEINPQSPRGSQLLTATAPNPLHGKGLRSHTNKTGMFSRFSPQVVQKLILCTVLGVGLYQCAALVLRNYSHLLPSFIAIYQVALPGFAALHHAHAPNFCSGVCIEVDLTSTKPMSPVMFGAFFEEINHAGEGGLYPELLCDRSFDAIAYHNNRSKFDIKRLAAALNSGISAAAPRFHRATSELQLESLDPTGFASSALNDEGAWQVSGTATLTHIKVPSRAAIGKIPATKGSNAVRLSAPAFAQLVNTGHSMTGFYIKAGSPYTLTINARAPEGPLQDLQVLLTSADGGRIYSKTKFAVTTSYRTQTLSMTPNGEDHGARFVIRYSGPGVLELDYVSLIQSEHFTDGVLKPFDDSILQLLKEMTPRFLRFPGGAYLEGVDISSAYRWKDTIGPLQDRPGHPNSVWGYWSTDGLGLHELLMLSEELDAEPVLVVNVGISQTESLPPALIKPWIQDALDEIEYISGNSTSEWGAMRAAAGHPDPWPLNYVTLGNEACLRPWYKQHYIRFAAAIRAAHPHIKLLANCDLGEGTDFDMWEFHTYRDPLPLFELRKVLDEYEGPKVAVTEYAAMKHGETLQAAIAEAAFMSAMERNCDKVVMAAYAPLLSHAKLRTWVPNLIVFESTDSGNLYGTPSFWVQSLYSRFQGESCASHKVWFGRYASNSTSNLVESSSTCLDTGCERIAVKVVNFSDQDQDVTVYFSRNTMERQLRLHNEGKRITLRGLGPNDGNTLDLPNRVAPQAELVDVSQQNHFRVAPFSLTVLLLNFE